MLDLKKKPDENERQYLWRVGSYIDSGQIDSWRSVTPIINAELWDDESDYKDECAYRKPYQAAKHYKEDVFSHEAGDEYLKQLSIERAELQKERIKLQTEKLELNGWLRKTSRDELLMEKILEGIRNLEPLPIPERRQVSPADKEWVLCFGDEHYGVEFCIKGLFGEVLNEYNPDIFRERMWDLADKVLAIVDKEHITTLKIFNFGDFCDGVLRVGQLAKLKCGVVDSTVQYMEFICEWLNFITNYVDVQFQMVHGNHSELRFFNQKNGSFKDENMGKVVVAYVKERLKSNPNFTYIENPTGLIFSEVAGFNFLGIHGEVKDMEKALKDLSQTYKVDIDFLAGGHLHHGEYNEVGVCKGTFRVPSVVGIDSFSMSLNKSASAGATMLGFEREIGKTQEYNIKL